MGNEWGAKNPERMKERRRVWYEKNKATERAKSLANKVRYQQRNRAYVDRVKKLVFGNRCPECGLTLPPVALHFDHLDPADKDASVSMLVRRPASIANIKAEIRKCRLICANCHAVHTEANGHYVKR